MVTDFFKWYEKRVDEFEQLLILIDGKKINFKDIICLESELFVTLGLDD